jgi:hypothetical protein
LLLRRVGVTLLRSIRRVLALIGACALLVGCGETGSDGGAGGGGVDPTPERLDGSSSREFEASDIARANKASPEVQAYCEGATSEAQEVGCLSHVDESDIP